MTSGNTENALYGTGAKPLAVYIDSTRAATFDNNGNFGLGTSSPDSRLHVHESSAGSVTAVGGTVATFESSGSSYLSILGSDGSAKGIFVGDTGHAYGGGLIYDDSNNLNGWTVRTNANNNRWHFTSLGHLNPAADDTYDIGSLSNQVQDVYISGDLYRDGVAVMTPHLLRNSNNTIDADGWYRVAKKTSGSGRSDFRLVVYSVGGNTGPSAAEFRIASDWTISASKLATVTLIHNGGVNNIESIRLVSDTVSGAFYVDLELFTSDNVSSPETFFIDIIEERQISGSVSYVDFTDLSTLGTNEVVISTLSVDDTRIGVADGGQDDIFRVRGNEILAGVPLRAADGSASAPSISFANDGNTGIYSAGDGNISLSINGTRKFQFDSGGEFRIEDDTPRIHLMESDTTDDNWRLMNTGGTFYISQTDNSTNLVAHALSITPDTQDLKVFGNVGINTSAAPTASLEVNGGTTGGDTLFKLGSRLTVSGSGVLEWGSGAAHGLLSWDTGEAIIGGLSGMGVSVVSNGGIEAMFVDTSQDVTIHNDVYLGEYLYHKSDTDTYLRFQTNQVDLSAGGGVLELTSTSLEIAEGIRLQSGSFSHLNLNVDTNGESVANSVYLTSNTNLVLVSDSNNNGTGNLIFGKGSEDYGVTDWTEFGRFTNAGALQIENLTASQYVKTDSNKRLISASSIPASDISGGTISGALSMTYLTQTLASGLETRSWAIAPNSGGGQFFLGYLEASDDQDGAISGVIHFANDYGETASQRLNFAFGQRDGSTWGHWWKEGSGSPADPVYIEVLDDGAGNMGIWAIAEDYARAHIEATGTSISSFTASGTLSDGTPPTTDTTLYDTRNAPEGWAKMESVRFGNGSASSPAITFESDTDCGWYRVGAGRPGLAADGVNVFNSTSSFAEFPNISRLLVPSGTGALPGIQALTDQDTGMFWPGSNTLAWSVGGVEELRLSASSLRPGSDAANTLGESTYRWSKVFAQAIDGGANSVTYESDIDHRFTVGGTEQMRLTSTGLGIGATPVSGARLNVNGHARIVGSNRLIFGDYTSNNDHGPYLSDNNTSGYFDIVTGYNTASGNEASNGIRFGKAKNTTWSTVMVLDTVDDRLGINNPSPSYTLDVTGTARFNNGSNQQVLISPVDGAIELVGSTPYIDFKDTTAEDFDIRLQRNGSNNIRFKNPSTTMFELSGTEAFLGGSTFTSGANLNITGQAASTGNRAGAIWMRGAVSDSIVQVNVRGGNFELGVGGSLDTAPPFAVDLQAGFTTVHELRVTDTGTGSSSPLIIRHWDTSDTDIDGLLPGSTFGKIIEGPSSAHVVVGLRENDSNDSFAIVSGGGDYDDDSTYDTLIARFGASGDVEIPNGSLTVGSTTLGRYTTTIGNGSSTSIGVTHNLGSKNLQIMLREVSTDEQVMVETVFTSTNVVTFEFTEAPGTNAIEVSIIAF